MRIAVLIIGLMLSIGLFLQSLTVTAGSGLTNDDALGTAAAVGMLMALLWVISCALVIPAPRVSVGLFGLSAVLGLGVAGSSSFSDLYFWGAASLLLAIFSYLGHQGKQAQQAKEAARDATQVELMRRVAELAAAPMAAQPAVAATGAASEQPPVELVARPTARKFCSNCGADMPLTARFCGECRFEFAA